MSLLEGAKILSISSNQDKIIVKTENHFIEFIQENAPMCCEEWNTRVIFNEKEYKKDDDALRQISELSNQEDLEIISHSFKRPNNTKKLDKQRDFECVDQTIYYIETNRGVIQLVQETFHNGYYSHDHNLYIKDKKGFVIHQNLQGDHY